MFYWKINKTNAFEVWYQYIIMYTKDIEYLQSFFPFC